jgi:outer membrane protein TolC
MRKILLIGIIFISSFNAKASSEISEKDVVNSALSHYPAILSYYEKVNANEGLVTQAKGFFDIRLKQNYYDKTRGFYDGRISDTLIEKELGTMGAKVYGGYRKSFDDFADYDRGGKTNDGGEYRAGVKLSLLRNSTTDENRLLLEVAKLDLQEAKIQMEKIKMEIARDARKAYWLCVSSAKIYQIYQDLYQLSLTRQKQLEEKSQKGAIAQIIVSENRKNILRRKSLLAKARQDFEIRKSFLALFFRDKNGKVKNIKDEEIPNIVFSLKELEIEKFNRDLDHALTNRPELLALKIQQNSQKEQLKYAENLYKPQLDLEFGASKDQGSGSFDKQQSENFVNLEFSIPLQQRQAKGATQESRSKLSALKIDEDLQRDKIKIEMQQIKIQIHNVIEIFKNLEEEVELAKILEDAEREKFKHGASNFFLVNMREQDTANSKAALLEVFSNYQEALADYQFASFRAD